MTRIVVWILVVCFALPAVAFIAAYFESTVTRTSYVEDALRWLGVHETMKQLFY